MTPVRAMFTLFLSLIVPADDGLAAALNDGPYVLLNAERQWMTYQVGGDESAPTVKSEPVSMGDEISVGAVGSLPSFKVRLRPSDLIAPDEVPLAPNTPLFVVADTHGQFEIFVELLQQQHVIDSALRWAFGKGHLAVLGDVFDRGPNQTEILWLLYKLEQEAAQAGGGVHLVLGNHEALVLLGDRGYLHPKYLRVSAALNVPAYADLWSSNALLGRWLRTKASVLKLGDFLCLHGGISRALLDQGFSLERINQSVRNALTFTEIYRGQAPRPRVADMKLLGLSARATDADREAAQFLVYGISGPLWYRGYFPEAAQEQGAPVATLQDIEQVLSRFKVRRILVGHTIVERVMPLYNGRVIAVQVALRRDEQGRSIAEALRIKSGVLYRARVDGALEKLCNEANSCREEKSAAPAL